MRALAANCAQCHGTEGRSAPGSKLPQLAGRKREDLRGLLEAFKEGRTRSTVMGQLAHGYSDDEIDALADYFARQRR